MSKNTLHTTAVHPGAVLRDELEEIGISQSGLAGHIGVLPKTINEIFHAREAKLSAARARRKAVREQQLLAA